MWVSTDGAACTIGCISTWSSHAALATLRPSGQQFAALGCKSIPLHHAEVCCCQRVILTSVMYPLPTLWCQGTSTFIIDYINFPLLEENHLCFLVSTHELHEPYPAKVCASSRAGVSMWRNMVSRTTPFQSDGWIREDGVVLSSLQSDMAYLRNSVHRMP